jgi:hypothetical protein
MKSSLSLQVGEIQTQPKWALKNQIIVSPQLMRLQVQAEMINGFQVHVCRLLVLLGLAS